MKTKMISKVSLAILLLVFTLSQGKAQLQVYGSTEFSSLLEQLSEAYMQEHPEAIVEVRSLEEISGMQKNQVALAQKKSVKELDECTCFRVVAGRDAIVPVISAKHPDKDRILQEGISPDGFAAIYSAGDTQLKGLLPQKSSERAYLASFMGIEESILKAESVAGPALMVERVSSDQKALGFVSLAYLMKMEEEGKDAGLLLVPVDMNANAVVDPEEDIYKCCSSLAHGIFIGRYPKALYSRIYAFAASGNEQEMAFLNYLVNDGQELVAAAGMMELAYSERLSASNKISGKKEAQAQVTAAPSTARSYLVVGGILLVLLVLFFVLGGSRASDKTQSELGLQDVKTTFPQGAFFDRSYTWTLMEKEGLVRVGLTDHLPGITGKLSGVILPRQGAEVKKGEILMTVIRDGKRLELKSPLSGTIEVQNKNVQQNPSLLNTAPFEEGWVCLVKPASWLDGLKSYMMGESYTQWLSAETLRLKEFFAHLGRDQKDMVALQDGGELMPGILGELGPDIWEEFQATYLNKSKRS